MDNKENENASVPENNTGKSSKKLSKKENRIITVIMFGVIAPLLLIAQHYYDVFVEFLSKHISRYVDEILELLNKSGLGSS
mgnify:FL=1|jgi:hypothetical protein